MHKYIKPISKILIFIFLISLIINTGSVSAQDLNSSYQQLKDSEFVQRLKNGGATETQVEKFMTDLDADVDAKGTITEDNFDKIMYDSLKSVITKTAHKSAYRAMIASYAEEILYTLEIGDLHPNMLPLRDAVMNSVLSQSSGEGENQGSGDIPSNGNGTGSSGNGSGSGSGSGSNNAITTDKQELINYVTDSLIKLENAKAVTSKSPQSTFDIFEEAIKKAQDTLNKSNVIQSELDAALVALNKAATAFNNSIGKNTGSIINNAKPITLPTEVKVNEEVKISKVSKQLSDIKGHWAEARIRRLIELGAVDGYVDGTFKPKNNITRSEFVKILVKAFNLSSDKIKTFKDTQNHWASEYISIAYNCGLIQGYDAFIFGPNDQITREQMVAIVSKLFDLKEIKDNVIYKDMSEISSWAKDAVVFASNLKIVEGRPDNMFNPKEKATRAEAVTIIMNAFDKKNEM